MKLPEFDEIEFSPLSWKEWLLHGDRSEFPSKKSIYAFLEQRNREGAFEWCYGIRNFVKNRRIRDLLNGYTILDLLSEKRTVEFLRFDMWELFEDVVAEMLREAIKEKEECTVAYVDRWPGFEGLDYIIVNSESKLGWKLGVQCKRYIDTEIPYNRVEEYGSYTKGVSAAWLYFKGEQAKRRFSDKRKIVLITFNAYRPKRRQKNRFNNLKEVWDSVVVLDDNILNEAPYIYKLRFDELKKIVRWC